MTLSDIVFPTSPGPIGSDLPTTDYDTGLSGFNRTDHPDYNFEANDYGKWVDDPFGVWPACAQISVTGWAQGGHFGGYRYNFWKTPFDQLEGTSAWFGYSPYVPVGFIYPDTWFLAWQNHDGPEAEPPQALELIDVGRGKRDDWQLKLQQEPHANRQYFSLGQVQEGRAHYFLFHIPFSVSPVRVRAWASVDKPPNSRMKPIVDTMVRTIYPDFPNDGFAGALLYRDYSSDARQIQTMIVRRYTRCQKARDAVKL